jgi:hypothetical protein
MNMRTTITRADGLTVSGPDIVLSRHDLLTADRLWCCRGIGYLLAVFRDRGGPGQDFRELIGFVPTDELGFASAKDFDAKYNAVARITHDDLTLAGGA